MATGATWCQHVRTKKQRILSYILRCKLMGCVLFFLSGHRLCDEPAPVENGYRIGDEFWEGKNVTYKCNKGYRLRGPLVRICNEIGNWTEEESTCEGEIRFIAIIKSTNCVTSQKYYFRCLWLGVDKTTFFINFFNCLLQTIVPWTVRGSYVSNIFAIGEVVC